MQCLRTRIACSKAIYILVHQNLARPDVVPHIIKHINGTPGLSDACKKMHIQSFMDDFKKKKERHNELSSIFRHFVPKPGEFLNEFAETNPTYLHDIRKPITKEWHNIAKHVDMSLDVEQMSHDTCYQNAFNFLISGGSLKTYFAVDCFFNFSVGTNAPVRHVVTPNMFYFDMQISVMNPEEAAKIASEFTAQIQLEEFENYFKPKLQNVGFIEICGKLSPRRNNMTIAAKKPCHAKISAVTP